MAARKCPQCLAVVPMGHAAAFTDRIECPGCKSTLEVAGVSRHLGIWAGLLAGFGVYSWVDRFKGDILSETFAWIVPVIVSFLAYSLIAAIGTMFTADLRLRPPEPVAEPVADTGHGSAHSHGGAHH